MSLISRPETPPPNLIPRIVSQTFATHPMAVAVGSMELSHLRRCQPSRPVPSTPSWPHNTPDLTHHATRCMMDPFRQPSRARPKAQGDLPLLPGLANGEFAYTNAEVDPVP